MKKLFYFAAAAVALAACAKNEVIPVNSGENQEITFNVAPKTKAEDAPQHTEFEKDKVFASWAYYLPEGKTWDENYAVYKSKSVDKNWKPEEDKDYTVPQEYISGAKISNNERTGNKWKCEGKSYYWPKDGGSLTFFAYSLNKGNLDFETVNVEGHDVKRSTVVCQSNTGIFAHIDLSVDKNVDFLVADPAKDKQSNVDKGKHFVDGVPTLFRHKLSYIIFNVKTDKAYSDAGKTLTLKSIKFNNVSYEGHYRDIASKSPAISAGFTSGAKGAVNYTSGSTESPFSQEIKSTNSGISSIDNYLYIPQTFADDATIDVVYTITTKVPKSDDVVETVTKTIKLKELFPTKYDTSEPRKVIGGGWEMGKKYTIYLTFTLKEILWDPAVQDWDPVTPATDRVVE